MKSRVEPTYRYWLLAIGYWLLAIGYWLLAIGNLVLAHYVQEHCSRLLRKAKRDAGHLLHHLGHDLARALPQALRQGYAVNLPGLS